MNQIQQFQETCFNIFIVISWLLLILTPTGIFNNYANIFYQFDDYVKIYICLFLIWRFNPIRYYVFHRQTKFTSLDRKITFSAGLIILSTTIMKKYFDYIANTKLLALKRAATNS